MSELELLLREIEDQHTRENFARLLRYVDEQVILDAEWRVYEILFDSAETNFKYPHKQKFVPDDVIILQVIGDRNVEFNHDKFDATNFDITVQGPVFVRFLAGRFKDSILSAAARKGLTNVSIGGSSSTGGPYAQVTRVMDCASTVAVDDWVHQSLTTNNRAVKETNNLSNAPTIGIVKDKPSSVTCTVVLHGIYALSVARGKIFLGSGGTAVPQSSAPGTGYLQTLGMSFGDGDIFVNPIYNRVKRV